jgi:hypothetical protein
MLEKALDVVKVTLDTPRRLPAEIMDQVRAEVAGDAALQMSRAEAKRHRAALMAKRTGVEYRLVLNTRLVLVFFHCAGAGLVRE